MRCLVAMVGIVFHLLVVGVSPPLAQLRPGVRDSLAKIRAEAQERSRVMEWVRALAVSPRLTGSPEFDAAGAWVVGQLKEFGLENVRLERWPFERRWTAKAVSLEVIEPEPLRVVTTPQTWSPGTRGPVTGPLRAVKLTADGIEARQGDFTGAFVLVQSERSVPVEVENRFQDFLRDEGAVATLERSNGPDGRVVYVRTGHTPEQDGRRLVVPALAVRPDDFSRLRRFLEKANRVEVRADVSVVEEPGRSETGFNVIADIVGVENPAELVVLGAHLDSIHAAQGATDNAAGCGVIIEAARLIVAAGLRPGRTIRIALWGGEEQGRRGSKAYVRDHLLDLTTDTRKPELDRTVVYFNVDRGSGRIHGILLEGNEAARPDVERWRLALGTPDLLTIDSRDTRGSDHLSFREVGVPVLTFMHDPLSYATTHHSTGDVVGEVREDHLRQAASLVARIAVLAAAGERLPIRPERR